MFHTTHAPQPGPPGWVGARRELLDFMVQGKINRGRHTDHPAGRHSIRTNQCPPLPSPILYMLDALPAAQPTVSKHWRQLAHSVREKTLEFSSAVLSAPSPYHSIIFHISNHWSFFKKQIKNQQQMTATPRDLVLASMLHHFLIDDLIHHLKPLDGFLFRDSDVLLLQRNRPERVVEEEQATVKVDSEKSGNVAVVGKSCGQRHQPHVFLGGLNVTNCPVNNMQGINISST